ncbi:transposase [Patescibacteria group bacterium]|nr:transposase [Patescibacteria group bacterium]MBU4580162.1 transposase [Patescibacteria group bacterium]
MEIYHTLNRGVDKRKIFLDNQDYFRFVHDLFEFNDQDRVNTTFYAFNKSNDIASRNIKRKPRKLLVDVLAFCLMPNHYHLLLISLVENGISRFMKKLNMGYAKYFNKKNKRTGALFEGRYKSILIKNESHFTHIPFYIHCNPLDLIAPEWRERRLEDYGKAEDFLRSYRWSSNMDYCGEKNFPSVTNRNFLLEYFGGENGYKTSLQNWLKELSMENFKDIVLE